MQLVRGRVDRAEGALGQIINVCFSLRYQQLYLPGGERMGGL
jgi:hypothetical protein